MVGHWKKTVAATAAGKCLKCRIFQLLLHVLAKLCSQGWNWKPRKNKLFIPITIPLAASCTAECVASFVIAYRSNFCQLKCMFSLTVFAVVT